MKGIVFKSIINYNCLPVPLKVMRWVNIVHMLETGKVLKNE